MSKPSVFTHYFTATEAKGLSAVTKRGERAEVSEDSYISECPLCSCVFIFVWICVHMCHLEKGGAI